MQALEEIQKWYAQQCDGDWEHSYGIDIKSLDNPGWIVYIDISETDLEDIDFESIKINESTDSWVQMELIEGRFRGSGDPSKLEFILEAFLNWSKSK